MVLLCPDSSAFGPDPQRSAVYIVRGASNNGDIAVGRNADGRALLGLPEGIRADQLGALSGALFGGVSVSTRGGGASSRIATIDETLADNGDYPYATPFPGGSLQRTERASHSLEVKPKNANQPLIFHVAETKWYAIPKDVSPYEFVTAYDRALEKSGWSVERDGIGSDGIVWAHYAKNGRDLWLFTRAQGGQRSINVADVGADSAAAKLKQELAASGHVSLYGIYFDTDSATPKPESETTLQHVLQVLTGDASLRLEVQGHTDDSGSPEHNAKLSGDRAASVKDWLIAHGIAASRLTSKGYGATKPVADNHTPEGKAKNRRVDLARI